MDDILRSVYKAVNNEWMICNPANIKKGDRICMYEPDGTFVMEGIATKDAYLNKYGTLEIETDNIDKIEDK